MQREALTRGVPLFRSPSLPDDRVEPMASPARCFEEVLQMHRVVVSVVAAVLVGMAMPTGVAADPTSICPDNMVLFPSSAIVSGRAKDKNNNGFICANMNSKGGPDDRSALDDIVV
jgi:hypothetical protein